MVRSYAPPKTVARMKSGEIQRLPTAPGLHLGYAPMHEPPTMVFL